MNITKSGAAMLFWLATLVGAAGAFREWLKFPLGAALNGTNTTVTVNDQTIVGSISFAGIYLVLLAFSVAASMLRKPAWATVFLSAATAILLMWPIYVLFAGEQWLEQYIRESMQFSELQEFLAKGFIPNSGLDKPLTLIPAFDSLIGRAGVVAAALGTGWYLSLLSSLVLLKVQLPGEINIPKRASALFGPMLLVPLLGLTLGWNGGRAEYARLNADSLLAAGQYAAAIGRYQFSLTLDPTLKLADSLLLNLARAQYALMGEAHPAGQIYLADADMRVSLYDSALLRLNQFDTLLIGVTEGTDMFPGFARRMRATNYKNRGRILHEKGDVIGASREYQAGLEIEPDALEVRFFLAKARLDLREYRTCIDDTKVLIKLTASSKMKADFYSTLADCYIGLGEINLAREAYSMAYQLDDRENYRALKGISGT